MTLNQAVYVDRKYKNKGITSSEHVYKCESDDKQQTDSHLKPCECAMLNDFEIYNVHAKSAEIEKWLILSAKLIMLHTIEKKCNQIE